MQIPKSLLPTAEDGEDLTWAQVTAAEDGEDLTWAQVEAVGVQAGEDGQCLWADAGAGHALDGEVAHQGGVVLPHDRLKGPPRGGARRCCRQRKLSISIACDIGGCLQAYLHPFRSKNHWKI